MSLSLKVPKSTHIHRTDICLVHNPSDMADVDWFSTEDSGGGGGGGKSGKKNQKRRAKAKKNTLQGESTSFQEPQKDLTEELRERLADAKINNDHALAGKLRKQLWIVQDLTAGVTPRVDPDDRDGQAMLAEYERTGVISLPSNNITNTAKRVEEEVPKAASPVFFTPVSGGAVIEDKRLKNLNKKLKQIEALKEKQKKGEKLESNQLEKIRSEASVRKEIQEIEELISKLSAEIKS